ncbi:MAG: hypothetical protein LPK85_14970, partial [Gammaproteobacteria bacterium]|nr:hypothetical protein [Gammaproteobacteria bacterium]
WIDFDETFEENWISKLKAFLSTGNNQTHKPDSIQFYNTFTGTDYKWFQTRAHRAEKYRWKYCAHEVLLPLDKDRTDRIVQIDILITHPSKAQRNDYTAQLLKSHEKYADGRTAYYLGREYLYNKDFQNAAKYLNDCLFVHNGWVAERGEAANMLADIHQTLNPNLVERYLYFYLAFCNTQREPYIALARYFYKQNAWEQVVAYGTRALSIAKPTSGYLNLYESNYQEVPHDLLCIAYHHLGNTTAAAHHAKQCLHYKPHEKRFQDNVSYYVNTGVIPPENSAS